MSGLDFVVEAAVGRSPVLRVTEAEPQAVDITALAVTARLRDALADWAAFFDEMQGDLSAPEVAEEFVSQGFKIAHKLRGELKGSRVTLVHPVTGESVLIERNVPR